MRVLPKQFCAVESNAIGEPLVGTAAHALRKLLISWPRAKWTHSLRQAQDMPEDVSAAIEAIAVAGRRVNLIHRQQQPSHLHRVFLMPERRVYNRTMLPVRWQTARQRGRLTATCVEAKLTRHDTCADYKREGARPALQGLARHTHRDATIVLRKPTIVARYVSRSPIQRCFGPTQSRGLLLVVPDGVAYTFRRMGANLAGVAELVDAPDSKSGSGDRVSVRFRPPAPLGFRALTASAAKNGIST